MDFLESAAKRLQKEQQKRNADARKRKENDAMIKAEIEAITLKRLEMAEQQRLLQEQQQRLKDEERQNILRMGGGIDVSFTLQSVPSINNTFHQGDRLIIPASCLETLTSQQADFPLFFQISLQNGDGAVVKTCGGVLEFSAQEGTVVLPKKVRRSLRIGELEHPSIFLQYIRLPKGKHAVLQPVSSTFYSVPEAKAVLEATLRETCATFSVGDVICVKHGGNDHELKILQVEPEPSVSVIDTDIAVDIVTPQGGLERIDSGNGRWNQAVLQIATPTRGQIHQQETKYYKFVLESALAEVVSSGDVNLAIELTLEDDSDANMYIATGYNDKPGEIDHVWVNESLGSKKIEISGSDAGYAGGGEYYIAIKGHKHPAEAIISYELVVKTEARNVDKMEDNPQERDTAGTTVSCQYCHQSISTQNLAIHEAFCLRNLVKCEHDGCDVMIRKGQVEDHWHCNGCPFVASKQQVDKHVAMTHHRQVTCYCGKLGLMADIISHFKTRCPERMISCRFCNQLVKRGHDASDAVDRMHGLGDHEAACGGRTASCTLCSRSVRMKEMEMHMHAFHETPPELPPPASSPASSLPPSASSLQPPDALQCPICNCMVSGSERAMNRHFEEAHSSPQSPQFLCPICETPFPSERQLGLHIDADHSMS